MSRRSALTVLAALLVVSLVPLSDAVFTSRSLATGSVRASTDWTPPQVQVTDPGTLLSGTVQIGMTATDSRSTVASVTLQIAPTNSGTWTTVCVTSTAPYGCSLVTTSFPDGRYDLRATAVDAYGNVGSSVVVSALVIDNLPPVVAVNEPAGALRGTVTIAATATDAGVGVASVRIQRALAGTTTWTDICTDTTFPYSCSWVTTAVASDYYDIRAIAVDLVGNTSTSLLVEDVLVDNVAPVATMVDPGTPLRGSVTLSVTASDALSGVGTVTVQYALAGTSTWATACTSASTVSPYTCRWTTTAVADATYDLRAVVTDVAGNTTTTATVKNRVVDNTQSSISVVDPGAFLRGVVTVSADAFSTAGVTSVRIQRAVSGTTTWVDLCTDTTAPYSCDWDTTTVPDGLYDLRAILVDGANKTTTSVTVTQRRVDNTVVRGADVQTANGGGTVGKIETNDRITFTYTEAMKLTTIMAGWTGAPQPVVVRVRDGGLIGGGNTDDTLDVFTTTALTTPVRLGTVNLRGDFLKGGKTGVWNATMTHVTNPDGTSSVTLTIGAFVSGGGVRTSGSNAAMVWTPSNVATDLSGNPCSTAPTTETGQLDKDF